MYQEIIDPPDNNLWPDYEIFLDWLQDQENEYKDNEAAAKHAYEMRRLDNLYGV